MIEKKQLTDMISLEMLNQLSKSICKITVSTGKNNNWTGTGFFMSIKYDNKVLINCLLTNNHIIPDFIIKRKIKIKITINDDKNIFIILTKKRIITYFPKPVDIALIEIFDDEELYKNIKFLSYDLNYIKNGYSYYLNKEIFVLQHPYGQIIHTSYGKILSNKNFEFEHNAPTYNGSSGSAIILIENKCVIGIHKGKNKLGQNFGTFIGKLFNEIVNDSRLEKRLNIIKFENQLETPKNENR